MMSDSRRLEEFRERLTVDRNALDEALLEQPELYWLVSEAYVSACAKRDTAYDNIKTIDAELDKSIRVNFEKSGKKVTDKVVLSETLAHADHQNAVYEHLTLKEQAEKLGALKESYSQRSYVLKELVNLYVSGYYAQSSVDRESSRAVDDHMYQSNKSRLAEERKSRGATRRRSKI
jgi:hypothetical protein